MAIDALDMMDGVLDQLSNALLATVEAKGEVRVVAAITREMADVLLGGHSPDVIDMVGVPVWVIDAPGMSFCARVVQVL